MLRPACKEDSVQLLKIYSDKNALPFFNSDNCHGDNFYYPTKEKMDSAIDSMIPASFFVDFIVFNNNLSTDISQY